MRRVTLPVSRVAYEGLTEGDRGGTGAPAGPIHLSSRQVLGFRGCGELEGERRTVSGLFADVMGSSLVFEHPAKEPAVDLWLNLVVEPHPGLWPGRRKS